jgi:tRNA-2-methylthio-N6-dimethylallyladenosine synthase
MNVHDSEKASFALTSRGWAATSNPAEADLILLNTCMVREKAAQRVFTRVGELRRLILKSGARTEGPIFGVLGCVAQAEAERIFDRSKDVKLVLGTQAIGRLPELVDQLEQGFSRAIDVRLSKQADFFELAASARQTKHIAYISIIEGCNKFCSFCIVPFTRGRERSRPADRIVEEAQQLAAQGYQEIHLLGQNVDSYGLSGRYRGNRADLPARVEAGEITFAELLDRVARESGVPRIKFTTSHPRDFEREIVSMIEAHDNLCEWIHLPVQSGSDRILRAMRRGYTRGEYMEKVAMVKRSSKEISLTGDVIVGFPGETEEDFGETLSLVAEVEYDSLYIFKYSPRPHTPAAAYPDSIPEGVKTERFLRLQELQDKIQRRRLARYLGRIVEVLVEGASARSAMECSGHTRCHKVVNFPSNTGVIGKRIGVEITGIGSHSLKGKIFRIDFSRQ